MKKIGERLAVVETMVSEIRENHLAHIQASITELRVEIKRLHVLVILAIVLSFLGKEAIDLVKLLM